MRTRANSGLIRGLALLTLVVFIAAFVISISVPAFGQSATTPTPGAGNSQIAFTSQRDGHAQVYLMAPDGSNQINVSKNTFADSQPAWSPDGTQLAFVSERDGNGEICVMNVDGSNQHCLTNQATADKKSNPKLPRDYEPTWSPDGQHIAFVSTRTGTPDIWAMNADGSNQLDLTQGASINDQPTWAPNLKSIAFVSTRDGNSEICVMDASGFNQRCLTNERTPNKKPDKTKPADSHPAWSPDSQQIAFVSTRERSRNRQLFVMNADGSNPTNVTKKISSDDQPAWSWDGQSIAFTSNRDGLIVDIYTTSLDGSLQTRLTRTTKGGDFDPAYQPTAPTGTPTATLTPTPAGPITFTAVPSDTPTPTTVPIFLPPSPFASNTATPVPTNVPPPPATNTPKPAPNKTNTPGPTLTSPPTFTSTPSHTPTNTFTPSSTFTMTPTFTATVCGGAPNVVSSAADSGPGTLRQAVITANGGAPGTVITFCPNVAHIQLSTGTIQITNSMTIRGNLPQSPTIDGGGVSLSNGPIFNVTTGTVSIQNLVLTNAVNPIIPNGDPAIGGGGAISQSGGSLTLDNLSISNSQAPNGQGGGVFVDGRIAGATLKITGSTITGNSAVTGGGVYGVAATMIISTSQLTGNTAMVFGGGLAIDFAATLSMATSAITGNTAGNGGGFADLGVDGTLSCTTAVFNSVTINTNQATNAVNGAAGGGVYNTGTCTLTITGGAINGNSANGLTNTGVGGGLYNDATGFGNTGTFSTINLIGVTVSANTANGGGGGMYNTIDGIINAKQSTISGNGVSASSATGGGGIFNDSASTAHVTDSTVSGNQAPDGGGIENAGLLTMTNSTLANNSAVTTGGGLLSSGGSSASLLQATVFGNKLLTAPGPGGNITVTGGTVSLQNSIVANSDGAAADPDISGAVTSLDYNLIQNPTGATITGATANNILGADPLLQPLGIYNGSPTQILPPSASSPVINVIPNTGGCNGAGVTADQRGVLRPQPTGGLCDIGAVEYNFALPPVPHKTRTVTPSKTPTSSPTFTPSKTHTPSTTPTRTPSRTNAPTVTPSPTPSATPTHTPSSVPSIMPSNTLFPATSTPTMTLSATVLPATPTPSPTGAGIKD